MIRRGIIFLVAITIAVPLAALATSPPSPRVTEIDGGLLSGKKVEVESLETIPHDLTMVGGEIEALGTIEGDLAAVGGDVFIRAMVAQDVNVAGGRIIVNGRVEDDARLAGGEVVIDSTENDRMSIPIGDNLSIAGGRVSIGRDTVVGGDVLIAGGDIEIEGTINGDSLQVYGGRVLIDSRVNGDVVVRADELEIGPEAEIEGDVFYNTRREASISPDAVIMGDIEFQKRPGGIADTLFAGRDGEAFALRFLSLLAGALLVGLTIRGVSTNVVERGSSRAWWRYPLIGFALLVLVPIGSIILLATAIGVPLGFFLLFWFGASLLVAWFYAAVFTGSMLWKWVAREEDVRISWQNIVIGALVFELLTFIPVFGWVVQLMIFLTALGALGAYGLSKFGAER